MSGGRGEDGSLTIWLLGLGICLLVLGGVGLDLWATVITHSRLSGLAEAIATAAGSGISEEHWRRTGRLRLDPDRAQRLGRNLASRHPDAAVLDRPAEITVSPDSRSVTVSVRGSTQLTLLRLVSSSDRIQTVVTARSSPHVVD